ncbi:hypothetical protein GGX14DRAFT_403427 [Mycena pura]|uniref:Uncharacterized protein n=1 Tax=Mycena pura TaxID=153505 RepID=A0AAD6UVZ7_9AGAR|nr:hypothetical protein GGX14DRAFT_403427 [Mycena pura]
MLPNAPKNFGFGAELREIWARKAGTQARGAAGIGADAQRGPPVGVTQRARERLGGRKQVVDGGQQTAGQQREVQRAEGQAAAGGGTGGGRRARSGRRVAWWDEGGGGGRRLAHPYFVQP